MRQLLKFLAAACSRRRFAPALFLMPLCGCAMLNSDHLPTDPNPDQLHVGGHPSSVPERPSSQQTSSAPLDGPSAADIEKLALLKRTAPAFGHSAPDAPLAARLLTPKTFDNHRIVDRSINAGHSFTAPDTANGTGLTLDNSGGQGRGSSDESGNGRRDQIGNVVPVAGTSNPRLQLPFPRMRNSGAAIPVGPAPVIEPPRNGTEVAAPELAQRGLPPSTNAFARADRPSEPPSTAVPPPAGTPQPELSAPDAGAVPEATMFDRFRNLAERPEPTAERRPTELIREQFRRLQNPFDIWRDNEPSQTAQVPGNASSVAAVPDQRPGEDPLLQLITSRQNQLHNWPRNSDEAPLQPQLFRRRQLDLRLLQLIADDPAAAMEAIDRVSSEEQEFWQELILAISRFRAPDEELQREEQMAQTVAQLRSAVRHLELLSPLTVRRIDFCSQVHGFGSIESYLTNDFKPGERVIIYVELDNLDSQLSHDSTWTAVVSGSLQILDDSSNEIEAYPLPTVEDHSTSLRTDYYHTYQITLPSHLHRGSYEVRLHLKDELGNRRVSSTLPFRIE